MKKFEARFLSFHAGLVFLLAMVLTFCGALNVAAQNGAAQKLGPQGPPVVTPAVTDQTPLELPNTFGANTISDLNQAGDYLFTPGGQSALFLRRSGAASPVRILQMGDEVPGFPGTRADLVLSPIRINGSAQLWDPTTPPNDPRGTLTNVPLDRTRFEVCPRSSLGAPSAENPTGHCTERRSSVCSRSPES